MKITLDILDLLNIVERVLNDMAYKTRDCVVELEDGRKVPQVARLVIPEEMFRKIFANLREEIKNGGIENVKN